MTSRRLYRPQILWLELDDGSGHYYYPDQVGERKALILELVGRWDGAEAIWKRNLAMSREAGLPKGTIHAILKATKLLQHLGRYDETSTLLDEANGLLQAADDPKLSGQVLAGRGVLCYRRGDHAMAMESYSRALSLYLASGFDEGVSNIYNNMGLILESRGEYQRAMDCYRAKRTIDEAAGNRRGIGTVLNNMGVCLLHQGDLQTAREMFQEKLGLESSIGNKAGVATALTNLGVVFRNMNDFGQALECCRRTIVIYKEIGDHRGQGITTNNMGNIFKEQGQYPQALECYQAAMAVAEAQGDRKDIAIYSGNIGQMNHQYLHDPDAALRHYDRAIGILRDMNQPFHLCDYLLYRAQLLLDGGRPREAEAGAGEALEAAEKSKRTDTAFQARVMMARLSAADDPEGAARRLKDLAGQGMEAPLRAEALFWLAMISGREADRKEAILAARDADDGRANPELNSWIARLEDSAARH